MDIYLIKRGEKFSAPPLASFPLVVLRWDNWNDYSFSTFFLASVYTSVGVDEAYLGGVKIQKFGQTKEDYTFSQDLRGPFSLAEFPESFCSLGGENYYENLRKLKDIGVAVDCLRSMKDAAFDAEIRYQFQNDECFKISLLRDSTARRSLDEAGIYFGGGSRLVDSFNAEISLPGSSAPHTFEFDFSSFHGMPHRLHAMVGINGVGKTQVMARLAMLMSRFSKKNEKDKTSVLETEGTLSPVPSIYNVVAISFSAFDEFERPTNLQGEKFKYSYCGLRSQRGRLLSEADLLENIRRIVMEELDDDKREILAGILGQIIKVDNIQSFVDDPESHHNLYERLSAGQRIALNALCHTLAKLEPRTLVLFDEPELHLHPQLLATMLSAFMELLEKYDSYAVVATHSAIVIQQIPSRCVHIVRRDRMTPIISKPRLEFFGETITEITRNVFLSTESDRDYRHTLDNLLAKYDSDVERIEELFSGKLSMSARIYLESRRISGEKSEGAE